MSVYNIRIFGEKIDFLYRFWYIPEKYSLILAKKEPAFAIRKCTTSTDQPKP